MLKHLSWKLLCQSTHVQYVQYAVAVICKVIYTICHMKAVSSQQ